MNEKIENLSREMEIIYIYKELNLKVGRNEWKYKSRNIQYLRQFRRKKFTGWTEQQNEEEKLVSEHKIDKIEIIQSDKFREKRL